VLATAVPLKNTPKRLNIAAKNTAILAGMTRVETTVAMALGASVHPFTKIDAHTKIITAIKPNSIRLSP
jgi:acyl-[acyl carrier protein]--UDP-N-acetylglucosamine O-acyltransferase